MLASKQEAYALLKSLGAPAELVVHLQLVGEAAEEIINGLGGLKIRFDAEFVRLGVAVHDAGKILDQNELSGPGNSHEPAGAQLLIENGVQPEVARCCLSHARYETMDVSFEELLVALADKLWKGKRVAALELRVIDEAAALLGVDRWRVFADLDACFEAIASRGDGRLARSRSPARAPGAADDA